MTLALKAVGAVHSEHGTAGKLVIPLIEMGALESEPPGKKNGEG